MLRQRKTAENNKMKNYAPRSAKEFGCVCTSWFFCCSHFYGIYLHFYCFRLHLRCCCWIFRFLSPTESDGFFAVSMYVCVWVCWAWFLCEFWDKNDTRFKASIETVQALVVTRLRSLMWCTLCVWQCTSQHSSWIFMNHSHQWDVISLIKSLQLKFNFDWDCVLRIVNFRFLILYWPELNN